MAALNRYKTGEAGELILAPMTAMAALMTVPILFLWRHPLPLAETAALHGRSGRRRRRRRSILDFLLSASRMAGQIQRPGL